MNKHFLLLVAALCTVGAQAATVYRDRIVPGGVCMVDFNKNTINAALIEEVYAGGLSQNVKVRDGVFPTWEPRNFSGIKVIMVNKNSYFMETATVPEAEMRKVAFLKLIKETCQ